MKEQFKKFLRDNKVVRKYNRNLKERGETFDSFIEREYSGSYISGAFPWFHSPEGHAFWKELEDKWMKIVSDENQD